MLTGIGTAYQTGIGGSSARGDELTIPDDNFPLPCTSIIGTQIDEAASVNGGILHCKGAATDGIDSLMPQGRVADGCIGNAHMGIEPGKDAFVVNEILTVVGSQDSPVPAVVDVIRLAAVHE